MSTIKKEPKHVAVLDLTKLTVPQILLKATNIVTKMTGNVHFPTPTPTLAAVSAAITLASDALATAQTKAKGTASPMHAAVKALEILLKQLLAYVETTANADEANGVAIIESAGMSVRKTATRKPKVFTAVNIPLSPGSVLLNTKSVPRSVYHYQMTTDPNTGSSWVTISINQVVKYIKTGLTSGTKYYFRVAVITKSIEGPWSPVLSVSIP
jgi:hypothetical protein